MEGISSIDNRVEQVVFTEIPKKKEGVLRSPVFNKVANRLKGAVGASVLGVAALGVAPSTAEAGPFDNVGKAIIGGVFNQVGAPYGVSVRPGVNGEPQVLFDPNQAIRMQQERAFHEAMQRPTQVTSGPGVAEFFRAKDIVFQPVGNSFYIYQSSNPNGRHLINGNVAKIASLHISQAGPSVFVINTVSINPQTRGTTRDGWMIHYNEDTKQFDMVK